MNQLRIAAVEPYFGGSHRVFLEGLKKFSRHQVTLFTLPPRQWKWRVRGAALHLARQLNEHPHFDVLLCSDFVNLADLRALLAPALRSKPVLYYMHENQLSYPLSPDEQFDPYFGFTNVLSCLSAEAVAFNSEFHKRDFLAHLPKSLPRLPDYEPKWVIESIAQRAEVLAVGLDLEELEHQRPPAAHDTAAGPRRVLWNHRWEFDKQPERFFAALEKLAAKDVPFVADVVGESFAKRPLVFDEARRRLGDHIGAFGYVSRQEYVQLLWGADVVVSTARQEFFGISMAEAVWCGAHPLAPDALVYPDFYGGAGARRRLYRDDAELERLLEALLVGDVESDAAALQPRLRPFGWVNLAPRFDARFEELHQGSR